MSKGCKVNLLHQSASIYIAHGLNTIMLADVIYVLERGYRGETDMYVELLQKRIVLGYVAQADLREGEGSVGVR